MIKEQSFDDITKEMINKIIKQNKLNIDDERTKFLSEIITKSVKIGIEISAETIIEENIKHNQELLEQIKNSMR